MKRRKGKMHCTHCGSDKTIEKGSKTESNGGEIFVAEELGGDIEFYDAIVEIKCTICDGTTYVAIPY